MNNTIGLILFLIIVLIVVIYSIRKIIAYIKSNSHKDEGLSSSTGDVSTSSNDSEVGHTTPQVENSGSQIQPTLNSKDEVTK